MGGARHLCRLGGGPVDPTPQTSKTPFHAWSRRGRRWWAKKSFIVTSKAENPQITLGVGADAQRHLWDCLRTGEPSESDGRSYLKTVAPVEDCYRLAPTPKSSLS